MGNSNSTEMKETPVNMQVLRSEMLRLGQDDREMEVCISLDHQETDLALMKQRCSKNPGHKDFISCDNLKLEDLPVELRYPNVLLTVAALAAATVKLSVSYTSPERPKRLGSDNLKGTNVIRLGTGWFNFEILGENNDQQCPLQNCLPQPHDSSPYFVIQTAAHVVWDDAEAAKTKVQFNFIDDEQKNVTEAYGVCVSYANEEDDVCHLVCVTHELRLMKVLTSRDFQSHLSLKDVPDSTVSFIISHPHGCSKKISFGNVSKINHKSEVRPTDDDLQENEELKKRTGRYIETSNRCVLEYTIPTCPGSSGAPVLLFEVRNGLVRSWCEAVHSSHVKSTNQNRSSVGDQVIVSASRDPLLQSNVPRDILKNSRPTNNFI